MISFISSACINLIALMSLIFNGPMINNDIHIRINQLGYTPTQIKTGIVLSNEYLNGEGFEIICTDNNDVEFDGTISLNKGKFGNFKFSYEIDFTKFVKEGEYFIQIGNSKSYNFQINDSIYNGVAESLLDFFKLQRCGYTNPVGHNVCHIADATKLITVNDTLNRKIDVTGGWHDAGDYVKFLNTTAFSTYMLLFSYEYDPVKFGFDSNKNNTPDILEEAKVGLDWMLRCNYDKFNLITQVQDLRDHDNGFRLPEDDPLEFDRPAFTGMGKNLIGIYSATMAIASRIWRNKFHSDEFADQCLTAAENLYSIRNRVPDIDSSGTGMYLDNEYLGKLALGAIEMYITTNREELLNDAIDYGDKAGPDHWWSWGNINSLAHYKISKYERRFSDYIKSNLDAFVKNSNSRLFGEGVSLTWGSNHTLIGIALQNILWKELTGNIEYDFLEVIHRDYILGRNQWGVSFLSGYGTVTPKHFHHQISHLKKIPLKGGFAAGPVSRDFLKNYNIPFEDRDKFSNFQTKEAVYRDDWMDYVTNEPTISANATAIFVYGNYIK